MKVKRAVVRQPDTGKIIVELEEIDAPVGEILELIKSGIVSAIKKAMGDEQEPPETSLA